MKTDRPPVNPAVGPEVPPDIAQLARLRSLEIVPFGLAWCVRGFGVDLVLSSDYELSVSDLMTPWGVRSKPPREESKRPQC